MANKIWRLPIEGCIGVVSTAVKTKRLTEICEPTWYFQSKLLVSYAGKHNMMPVWRQYGLKVVDSRSVARTADGISLDTFTSASARTVDSLFALLGFSHLMLAGIADTFVNVAFQEL